MSKRASSPDNSIAAVRRRRPRAPSPAGADDASVSQDTLEANRHVESGFYLGKRLAEVKNERDELAKQRADLQRKYDELVAAYNGQEKSHETMLEDAKHHMNAWEQLSKINTILHLSKEWPGVKENDADFMQAGKQTDLGPAPYDDISDDEEVDIRDPKPLQGREYKYVADLVRKCRDRSAIIAEMNSLAREARYPTISMLISDVNEAKKVAGKLSINYKVSAIVSDLKILYERMRGRNSLMDGKIYNADREVSKLGVAGDTFFERVSSLAELYLAQTQLVAELSSMARDGEGEALERVVQELIKLREMAVGLSISCAIAAEYQ